MQALNVGNLCPSSAANAEIFPPEVVDIFELLALLFEAVDSAKFRISGFLKLPIACSACAATSQADEISSKFLPAIFGCVGGDNRSIELLLTFYTGEKVIEHIKSH
jgi:hypothetical protein